MLDVDRVWARISQRPDFVGRKIRDYRLQVITATYTIAAAGTANAQAVNFGPGAVLVGVIAACSAQSASIAATQTYRPGLDAFTVDVTYQADNRSIVGSAQAHGSAVFGPYGDQFPGMEIVMPQNTALVYDFTNLTNTIIQITLGHHCLLPGAIG